MEDYINLEPIYNVFSNKLCSLSKYIQSFFFYKQRYIYLIKLKELENIQRLFKSASYIQRLKKLIYSAFFFLLSASCSISSLPRPQPFFPRESSRLLRPLWWETREWEEGKETKGRKEKGREGYIWWLRWQIWWLRGACDNGGFIGGISILLCSYLVLCLLFFFATQNPRFVTVPLPRPNQDD